MNIDFHPGSIVSIWKTNTKTGKRYFNYVVILDECSVLSPGQGIVCSRILIQTLSKYIELKYAELIP